jgi:hypothetical protein
VTPVDRLSRVDALLGPYGSPADAGAARPPVRAAAFLLRRSLEECLDALLSARFPGLPRCSFRTRCALLARLAGPALAGRCAAVWHELSLACHYHGSILPPPVDDVHGWRREVAAVLQALDALDAPAPGTLAAGGTAPGSEQGVTASC